MLTGNFFSTGNSPNQNKLRLWLVINRLFKTNPFNVILRSYYIVILYWEHIKDLGLL